MNLATPNAALVSMEELINVLLVVELTMCSAVASALPKRSVLRIVKSKMGNALWLTAAVAPMTAKHVVLISHSVIVATLVSYLRRILESASKSLQEIMEVDLMDLMEAMDLMEVAVVQLRNVDRLTTMLIMLPINARNVR